MSLDTLDLQHQKTVGDKYIADAKKWARYTYGWIISLFVLALILEVVFLVNVSEGILYRVSADSTVDSNSVLSTEVLRNDQAFSQLLVGDGDALLAVNVASETLHAWDGEDWTVASADDFPLDSINPRDIQHITFSEDAFWVVAAPDVVAYDFTDDEWAVHDDLLSFDYSEGMAPSDTVLLLAAVTAIFCGKWKVVPSGNAIMSIQFLLHMTGWKSQYVLCRPMIQRVCG